MSFELDFVRALGIRASLSARKHQFKEARKIGDKYAKFRAFALEGLPQ